MTLWSYVAEVTMCVCRDVGYESYKAYRKGPTLEEAAHFSEPTRIGMIATKRAVFQSIASMYELSPCSASRDVAHALFRAGDYRH